MKNAFGKIFATAAAIVIVLLAAFLPAEINSEDIRYALFRDRAGLLCDLEDAAEFLA